VCNCVPTDASLCYCRAWPRYTEPVNPQLEVPECWRGLHCRLGAEPSEQQRIDADRVLGLMAGERAPLLWIHVAICDGAPLHPLRFHVFPWQSILGAGCLAWIALLTYRGLYHSARGFPNGYYYTLAALSGVSGVGMLIDWAQERRRRPPPYRVCAYGIAGNRFMCSAAEDSSTQAWVIPLKAIAAFTVETHSNYDHTVWIEGDWIDPDGRTCRSRLPVLGLRRPAALTRLLPRAGEANLS
jgi:hypothetical protein